MSLVNDMLDVSKLESAKLELHYSCFDIYELLLEIQDDFEDLVKSEEFTCRMKFTPREPIKDSSYVIKITPTYLVDTRKFGI